MNLKDKKGLFRALLLPTILILLFIILYYFTFDAKIFLGGDNVEYYILGKSLAAGEGYTNIHLFGHPPANHFPPGYPFIMSLFIRLFGDSVFGLEVLNGLFFMGSVLLTYQLVRKITDNNAISFITSLFVLFNAHYLYYSSIMMSEMPFTFFSLLALYFTFTLDISKKFFKNKQLYMLVVTLIIALYIKTIGLALIGAILFYFLVKKKFLYIIFTGSLIFISILPWQKRSENLGGNSYVKQLMSNNPYNLEEGALTLDGVFLRLNENTQRYVTKEIPNSIFPRIKVTYTNENGLFHGAGASQWAIGLFLIVIMVVGIVAIKNWEHRITIIVILSLSFIVLLLWPQIWYGIRFIFPFVPILLFLFLNGMTFLLGLLLKKIFHSNSSMTRLPFVWVLGIFWLFPTVKTLNENSLKSYDLNFLQFKEIAEKSKTLPDSALVVCRKPNLFYFFSGKTTSGFLFTNDYEAQMTYLKEQKMTHIMLDQLGYSQTRKHLVPFMQYHTGKFKLVFQSSAPNNYLYEFVDSLGYSGERFEGKKEGFGTFIWPDGSKYIGQWKNDRRHGYGEQYNLNGSILRVNWIEDKQDGAASIVLVDSSVIRCNWNLGKVDSIGQYFNKEGEFLYNFNLLAK